MCHNLIWFCSSFNSKNMLLWLLHHKMQLNINWLQMVSRQQMYPATSSPSQATTRMNLEHWPENGNHLQMVALHKSWHRGSLHRFWSQRSEDSGEAKIQQKPHFKSEKYKNFQVNLMLSVALIHLAKCYRMQRITSADLLQMLDYRI